MINPIATLEWLEGRPMWQRHILTGALLVLALRGAWIVFPVVAVVILIANGLDGLLMVGQMFLLLGCAASAGGLAGALGWALFSDE